jgi:peptide/nickel transport system permease protein
MWAYAAKRVMWLIPTLLGVSLIIFLLLHISPGDPATVLVSIEAGDAELAEARKELGLDRALPIQYGIWLGRVLRGDLGRSYARRTEVRKDLTSALKNTLILASASAILVVTVGVALGTIAAKKKLVEERKYVKEKNRE